MLLGPNTVSVYLAASLIGFAAGTSISVLLLVLTARAVKGSATRTNNILFVTCCLAWNLAGLAHAVAIASGASEQGRATMIILACQFTAAAAWPVTVFALWGPLLTQPVQRAGFRLLQTLAGLSCIAIAASLWYGVFAGLNYGTIVLLKESTAYNGAILLIMGIALFRERLVSRAMRIPSLTMLVGVFGATLADVIQRALPFDPDLCSALRVVSEQLTLLIVLGAFFLFSRYRFSDLFIRYSLRIMLAALTAVAFRLLDSALFLFRFGGHAAYPGAVRSFVEVLLAVAMLFLFTFVDRHIGEGVDRWIFRAPDYRALLRQMSEGLAQLRHEIEIAATVETSARETLDLKAAHLLTVESLPEPSWPRTVRDGEVVELDRQNSIVQHPALADVELLVPVRSDGRVSHVLAVAPGPARRGLVTHEVDHLRNVAALFGQRLDALHNEERRIQAQNREALLQQQVTEAELRALRAQINPHFLFNSLNSIANLVVTNPERAETMTLRLARVFRHVLANSARPLISLHEETEFLETYLQIEEARFGSRLQVNIAVDPTIAMEQIPTLILQPIVENALKHGLGPKPGPGHLWITADAEGDQVRLRVEDDGVGPENGVSQFNGKQEGSNGVGLENVALRLNALYQDHGRIVMETRRGGGTCVTILLPRECGASA